MQVNVKQFLEESGITEAFYPGKKLVHTCRQPGEYKSHCVVLDWRNPEKIRIEVKAGLSGKDLEPAKLKYYPVSFQTPTYVDIEVVNDNDDEKEDEEEKGKGSSGKGGSGGKKPKKNNLDAMKLMASEAFGDVMEGKVPELGNIKEMVVLGTQIAAEAYGNVMGKLAHGIAHAKVSTTDMLSQAGKFVTKYMPPSFMKPTGDEQASYKYDREKNADIGYKAGLG
jgi:hypothetical protein